jgi:hypothetical protein
MDDWQVDDALRTLQRAEEIKKDPKLMAKVRAMAKDKLAALTKVTAELNEKDAK